MEDVKIYYLVKDRALELQFDDGQVRTFAPSNTIPKKYADQLLTRVVTVGGCCGKESKTVFIFATEEQLTSGKRKWIE